MKIKRTQNCLLKAITPTATFVGLAFVLLTFESQVSLVNCQFSRNDYRSGFLVQNPCVSKQTCSECLQTPTCAWCMKEVRYI